MKNRIKAYLLLCILISIVVKAPIESSAANGTFEFGNVETKELSDIVESLEIAAISEPAEKYSFSCFSVNQSGQYVLGFDHGKRDTIMVYDSDGTYLFGVSFNNNGGVGVGWDGQYIVVYSVRSDLAIWFDKFGTCINVRQIRNTEYNQEYWQREVFANQLIVDDVEYTAEHWLVNSKYLHWSTYQSLIKSTPEGERTVLYESTSYEKIDAIVIVATIGIAALVMLGLWAIMKKGKGR